MVHLVVLAATLLAQVPPPDAAAELSAELARKQRTVLAREKADLDALADRLRKGGDAAGARVVRGLVAPPAPKQGATRFLPLPEVVAVRNAVPGLANIPTKPASAPPWQAEVARIRSRSADALFELAVEAASKPPKHYALADLCLRELIARQPDHAEARRLLGYVAYEGGWATPFAVQRLKAGEVLHPTFGWVPKGWLPHLDRGELPAPLERGQREPTWLAAAEADRLHGDWDRAWRITTEHFRIQTNVPLSEAIAFGQQLESFHELFFSLLGDVFGEALPLARRFRDKRMAGEPRSEPHAVHYYATRQEYLDRVVPIEGPGAEGTLGIYIPPRRPREKRGIAYFFRDEKGQLPVTATLFHEVSHQLLFESGLGDPRAYEKNEGNYWVLEGLGTYFETLVHEPDGSIEVGGMVGKRIEEAVRRLAREHEYIPLAQFVRYGQKGLHEGDVYLKYQEANALAVFFMQAHDGRYREPFLDYVRDAARGRLRRASGRSLEDRIGVAYKDLDAEFLEFLGSAAPARKK